MWKEFKAFVLKGPVMSLAIGVIIGAAFGKIVDSAVKDLIMPIITSVKFWMPIYVISLALLIWKGGKKGRFLALVLIVGIVISDQTNSTFLKSLFDRVRPCHTVETARLLIGCPGGLSFPSSHAFNNFCAAMIISMF